MLDLVQDLAAVALPDVPFDEVKKALSLGLALEE